MLCKGSGEYKQGTLRSNIVSTVQVGIMATVEAACASELHNGIFRSLVGGSTHRGQRQRGGQECMIT